MKAIGVSHFLVLVVEQESNQSLAQFCLTSLGEQGKQKRSGQPIPCLPRRPWKKNKATGRRLQPGPRYAHRVANRAYDAVLPNDACSQCLLHLQSSALSVGNSDHGPSLRPRKASKTGNAYMYKPLSLALQQTLHWRAPRHGRYHLT